MNHRIYKNILQNKMTIMTIPMDTSETVSIGIFVRVGSRYETEETNGISHFLEHMMFKGTKHFPGNGIPEHLDSVGASYNAETSYESTSYYVSGHKDNIELFIKIMCDIYSNPLFREDDIITERGVVVEELNMYKDDPYDIIHDMLHEKMFCNSPLKYSVIGTKKNILSFTRNTLTKFRETYYVPDRTVIIVSGNFGDFDRDEIFQMIKKKMNKIPINKEEITIPISDQPIQIKPTMTVKERKDIAQTNIIIAFKAQSHYAKESDIYDIIGNILSTGSSSRLFNLLRNKLGIVYFTSAYNYAYTYEGTFVIQIGADNKRVDEAIKKVLEEINKIRQNKGISEGSITKEEVEKAKRIKITAFSLGLQTPLDYMSYNGSQELHKMGNPNMDRKYDIKSRIKDYESITLEQVNIIIKDLFRPENLNIIVYGIPPKSK